MSFALTFPLLQNTILLVFQLILSFSDIILLLSIKFFATRHTRRSRATSHHTIDHRYMMLVIGECL